MGFKTMLRQIISKWGIMSIELQKAFEEDKDEAVSVDFVDTTTKPEDKKTPADTFFEGKETVVQPELVTA